MHRNPIYDPREDSFLLAEAVKLYAYGKVLDVGTGSGIQAVTAAQKKEVKNVLAVDINSDALVQAKKNHHYPNVSYIQSDLFSNIDKNEKFDTVIFNPPYLPDDPNIRDVALDGGEKGYEVSVRFLKQARNHVEDSGQILFLFSSLTQKEVIDETLIQNAYIFEEVIKQKLDFETLYIYKIRKVESVVKGAEDVSFFSKGKRGLIYTAKKDGVKVAIKIKNPKSEAETRIFIEGKNLEEVNKLGIGPKLLASNQHYVVYEFVEGQLFPVFLLKAEKKDVLLILNQVYSQMRTLDKNLLNKEEMANPYKHVLVTPEKKVVLIDFERSSKTLKPRNVTQFTQYVVSKNIFDALKNKRIIVDKEKILKLAAKYKKTYDDESYEEILKCIS